MEREMAPMERIGAPLEQVRKNRPSRPGAAASPRRDFPVIDAIGRRVVPDMDQRVFPRMPRSGARGREATRARERALERRPEWIDVREIRRRMGITQSQFAHMFAIPT